jgi:hypothetical protein
MDPSVGKSIPSGLALQIARSACHAAALKGESAKFLCWINHPHPLRAPVITGNRGPSGWFRLARSHPMIADTAYLLGMG